MRSQRDLGYSGGEAAPAAAGGHEQAAAGSEVMVKLTHGGALALRFGSERGVSAEP